MEISMEYIVPTELRQTIKDDALSVVCGKQLGSGASRYVFEYALDPKNLVVKIEGDSNPLYQNAKEFLVWQEYMHYKKMSQWFAPVVFGSHNLKWLVMKRTSPVTMAEVSKIKRVPGCFTDLKVANWGRYEGRIVCHDYGTLLLGHDTKEMRVAKWWEG